MPESGVRLRSWVRASDEEIRAGMLAYVSVVLGTLVIDGIVVRKTAAGRLTLSFPSRTSRRSGQRHPIVRPTDDLARRAIEEDVLAQLAERMEIQR